MSNNVGRKWQARVIAEKDELSRRLNGLAFLIASERFGYLAELEQDLLNEQYEAMLKYQLVLKRIIDMFSELH